MTHSSVFQRVKLNKQSLFIPGAQEGGPRTGRRQRLSHTMALWEREGGGAEGLGPLVVRQQYKQSGTVLNSSSSEGLYNSVCALYVCVCVSSHPTE